MTITPSLPVMSAPAHPLDGICNLHLDDDDDDEVASAPRNSPHSPPMKTQFFYVSSILLDDPLSPLPPISSNTKSSPAHQPQPFSVRDNAALKIAWQGIEHLIRSGFRNDAVSSQRPRVGERGRTLGELVRFPRFQGDGKSPGAAPRSRDGASASVVRGSADLATVDSVERTSSTAATISSQQKLKMPTTREEDESSSSEDAAERGSRRRHHRPASFRRRKAQEESTASSILSPALQIDGEADTDISGRPFARTPTLRAAEAQEKLDKLVTLAPADSEMGATGESQTSASLSKAHTAIQCPEEVGNEEEKVFIPVGISRLHLVEMPDLLMKPIYWSPVNDVSAVVRGTWFYATNMLPVESGLANWLETGYQEMQPWTEAWQEELNSCVEIGAEAEMKVVYHLFPERKSSRPGSGAESKPDDTEFAPVYELLAEGQKVQHENLAANTPIGEFRNYAPDSSQRYKNHRVIYVNARQAQILRPSLAPSVSRNRRPLAAVRKGREIGVPIVRGFNRREWERFNPPSKMTSRAAHAKVGAYMSRSGNAVTEDRQLSCSACKDEEQKHPPKVTDLVLVIHGIGQKLSERMDSYNFTHSINSFRRDVNVELSSEAVQGNLRNGQGGVMVLPINWRLTLSFLDDETETKNGSEPMRFKLEDITPDTLPAIRSLISDVMLDIPYYLSHHKQKMISAVIREANRVYRLWCRNNPGFHENGRVHLIAHSLGSAMAMDILSQQPTKILKQSDLSAKEVDEKMFEFDTTNLFCCGSPASFFLLLNKSTLIPRGGRQKPGTDAEDERGITGEAGTYGCLAVDNVYNVMAPYDPISYCLNPAVDSEYAASLKAAVIPSMRQGLLASMGLKWGSSNSSRPFGMVASATSTSIGRPSMNKMPSTIEMDTHNFTQEELAERRMFLLNDNGQIDFTLTNDGGPLDFQYWSMLSAHSSYWLRQDFVRFLVVEIGREQGRQGTLTALVAQKKRLFKAGKIA